MPLDASIYGLIKPQQPGPGPLDQYAQAMTLRGLMDDQGLKQLQRQQLERGIKDEDETRAAWQGAGGDMAAVRADLTKRGLYKQIQALDKAELDKKKELGGIEKTAAEIEAAKLKTIRDMTAAIQDDGGLMAVRERAAKLYGPDAVARMSIPQSVNDPNFRQWQEKNIQDATSLIKRLEPNYSVQDFGGTKGVVQSNPEAIGGVTGMQPKTQTPDSVASVGATIRGQNMVDARSRDANATAAGNQAVSTEGKLRDDYNKASQDFVKVRDAHQRVIASAEKPSAAGDLALIFNYMKVLDPGSTVREGEFATAQNSGSIPERIRAQYNKAIAGERLSDVIRNDFVDRSGKLYQAAEVNQRTIEKQYTDISKRSKANPENVVAPQRVVEAPAAAPPKPKLGERRDGYLFNGGDPADPKNWRKL